MSRKLFAIALPIVFVFSLLLGACGPAVTPTPTAVPTATLAPTATPEPTLEPTAAPLTFTDGLGRTITLAAPAQRIVSVAPSNTEIVFAIGAGGQLVGRDDLSNYPSAAADVPSIGNTYPHINAEQVVALHPDLVLAASVTDKEDVAALEKLGLTVYAFGLPLTVEDILASIQTVGQLTGHTVEAEKVVTDMKTRLEGLKAKVAQAPQPKVFYEIDDTDPNKPWTAGPKSFTNVLLTLAGGQNIGAVGTGDYFQMSLEEIVNQDPEVIIYSHASYSGRKPEEIEARAGWSNITAIKNGAVYAIDADMLDRPGPRIVDGLEALAKLIHPDLFK
jgi:iron complex transport system substrate-binding protein